MYYLLLIYNVIIFSIQVSIVFSNTDTDSDVPIPYEIEYVDYSYYDGGINGNDTTLTGVRHATGEANDMIYLSGYNFESSPNDKMDYKAFVYYGSINGTGEYHGNFQYPSDSMNVTGTYFYGPSPTNDTNPNSFIAVGNYDTIQGGGAEGAQYACLYNGYFNGTGAWVDINPQSLVEPPGLVNSSILHSVMDNLAVGKLHIYVCLYVSMCMCVYMCICVCMDIVIFLSFIMYVRLCPLCLVLVLICII